MYIFMVWLLPGEIERLKSLSTEASDPQEKQAKFYLFRLISDNSRWLHQPENTWPMFYHSRDLSYNGVKFRIGLQEVDNDSHVLYDKIIDQLEILL